MAEVWDAYRRHKPRCRAYVPKGLRRLISSALDENTVSDVTTVIDWAFKSADPIAAHLQENGYLGLDNILRVQKLPHRVMAAQEWKDGAGAAPSSMAWTPIYADEGE